MNSFTAHQLRFDCEALEPVDLYEWQGSGIRGALFRALWANFCVKRESSDCSFCLLAKGCPVALLIDTLNPDSNRGVDVPRPFTIESPSAGPRRLEPGQPFQFGLTMFAKALNLFPYVILALERMEQAGVGRRVRDHRNLRGRFRVLRVKAMNPLTAETREIARVGGSLVKVPDVPVTHAQVMTWVRQLLPGRLQAPLPHLKVQFVTPTRIRDRFAGTGPDNIVTSPLFRPLFQRLLERLTALTRHFGEERLTLDFVDLVRKAEKVSLVDDRTHWVDFQSHSDRQHCRYPSGGFLGGGTYEAADWAPFLPWLAWGQFTQVGKDAVKGNGQYRIILD